MKVPLLNLASSHTSSISSTTNPSYLENPFETAEVIEEYDDKDLEAENPFEGSEIEYSESDEDIEDNVPLSRLASHLDRSTFRQRSWSAIDLGYEAPGSRVQPRPTSENILSTYSSIDSRKRSSEIAASTSLVNSVLEHARKQSSLDRVQVR
jgi:hypothetical protein